MIIMNKATDENLFLPEKNLLDWVNRELDEDDIMHDKIGPFKVYDVRSKENKITKLVYFYDWKVYLKFVGNSDNMFGIEYTSVAITQPNSSLLRIKK